MIAPYISIMSAISGYSSTYLFTARRTPRTPRSSLSTIIATVYPFRRPAQLAVSAATARRLTVNLASSIDISYKTIIGIATRNMVTGLQSGVIIAAKAVSYTHLRAHETRHDLVCRLLLEKKKTKKNKIPKKIKRKQLQQKKQKKKTQQ